MRRVFARGDVPKFDVANEKRHWQERKVESYEKREEEREAER